MIQKKIKKRLFVRLGKWADQYLCVLKNQFREVNT